MIYPPFTLVDAELILSESEGRANAGANSGHGHAGERHVKIINGDLMHRMTFGSAPKSGIPIYTAFVTFAEQVRAFHEALTSDALALPLNTFYRKGGKLHCDYRRAQPFQIRVATGGGVITRWDRHIHFDAEYRRGAYRDLHLITLFPYFEPGTFGEDKP